MLALPTEVAFLALLTACSPPVDPPPLAIQRCSIGESPTELARYDDPLFSSRYEPFDLGHAITIGRVAGRGTEHDLVDNCGGPPLRLQETFDYRPGAARVGGDIVLCGPLPGDREGVWELLQDGSAGQDLGLGRGCLSRVHESDYPTEAPAYGFVWGDSGWAQHLPDGTVRALPFPGALTRVGDTWLVRGEGRLEPKPEPDPKLDPEPEPEPDGEGRGEVAMLGPNGADAVVLDLPAPIAGIVAPSDRSSWVILVPEFEGPDAKPLYALDTLDGSWFTTAPVSPEVDPNLAARGESRLAA